MKKCYKGYADPPYKRGHDPEHSGKFSSTEREENKQNQPDMIEQLVGMTV